MRKHSFHEKQITNEEFKQNVYITKVAVRTVLFFFRKVLIRMVILSNMRRNYYAV